MLPRNGVAYGLSVVVALSAWCSSAIAQEAVAPKPPVILPSIIVTQARMKPIVDRVVATGTIEAVEETYVLPLVDGLSIRTLQADVGDRIEAQSTLATLNEDMLVLQKSQYAASLARAKASLAQYDAQLAEAKANAEEAVSVSERSKRLAAAGSFSTAQADQERAAAAAALARVTSAEQLIEVANADIKLAEAQMSDIDLRLARTSVKAPVAGIIAAKTAKIGAIANGAGEPLFTIIRDGAVEMKADVSEDDLVKLAVGQKATVALADGKIRLEGKIRLISPKVDAQTRLGTVYISLFEGKKARIGMYADAKITIEEKQAIALPLTAVTTARDVTVRKVEDGVVRLVDVTTGIQDGRFIEIVSGLRPGDEVVAKAGAYVRDGDRINPVKSAAAETN